MSWTIFDNKKQCKDCKRILPVQSFSTFIDKRNNKRYPNARCRGCAKKATRAWRSKPENAKKIALYSVEYKERLRKIVYEQYGNCCACCYEANPMFLTLDHVNDDGAIHRTKVTGGTMMYNDLIKRGFPSDIQLLCWNCNCGRQRNKGVCPHADPSTLHS